MVMMGWADDGKNVEIVWIHGKNVWDCGSEGKYGTAGVCVCLCVRVQVQCASVCLHGFNGMDWPCGGDNWNEARKGFTVWFGQTTWRMGTRRKESKGRKTVLDLTRKRSNKAKAAKRHMV